MNGIRKDIVTAKEIVPTEGVYVIEADDTAEAITADASIFFQSLRLYPAKEIAASGLLTQNDNAIQLGRGGSALPDRRAATDVDYPVEIDLGDGGKMQLARIKVRGKIGDGVFYSYF